MNATNHRDAMVFPKGAIFADGGFGMYGQLVFFLHPGQAGIDREKLVPEGIEGVVPYAGPVEQVLNQFIGGLRSSLGYNGCRTITEMQDRGRFVRITASGTRESHPHDITMIKDAPNYKTDQ